MALNVKREGTHHWVSGGDEEHQVKNDRCDCADFFNHGPGWWCKHRLAVRLAQGDRRPVAGHPAVMENLRGILRDREPAYAAAHFQIDTSGKQMEQSVDDLVALIEPIVVHCGVAVE